MNKTQQLLAYIVKNHSRLSVTGLMKLAYLSDLVSIKKNYGKITAYEYIRYKHGPFDKRIYEHVRKLVDQKIIYEDVDFSPTGDEFIVYKYNTESEHDYPQLPAKAKGVVDEVLESLKGYGAKALTEVSYRTKPMLKLGAKLDNEVGLNQKLDLMAK